MKPLQGAVLYLLGALLCSTAIPVVTHPASSREDDEKTIKEFLEDRENIKLIENVLVGMERLLGENLIKLYNKINSLTQVSAYLLQQGGDMAVATGKRGDMSDRCPLGFMAVPGDRNCY